MAQLTMYPAKAGSKRTTLTADLAIDGTQAFVGDLSAFPAAPNLATFKSDETVWETCLYTAKSAEYGAGYLTITRSGEGHDSSSSGGALSWSSGALVFRSPTALDHDRFKTNIEDLAANKQPLDATLTAFADITTAANKLPYATGEDTFGVCDFTPLGQSLIGTTTASAVRDLIAAASSTTATQNIYVDKAATGTGTGVDWPNAFTTIQAAVNSLPAVINHAVTIIIRKGSTPYDENITIQRVIAAGSIVIRGEYYWYGLNASSKTGKLDINASDPGYAKRAQIQAGDFVWMTKWSGTPLYSTPSESIIDTVASVNGTEITLTTNTAKALTTAWTYQIVKTRLNGSILPACNVTINGIAVSGPSSGVCIHNSTPGTIATVYCCYLYGNLATGLQSTGATINAEQCLIKNQDSDAGDVCIFATRGSGGVTTRCVLSGGYYGMWINASFQTFNSYNHIMSDVPVGVYCTSNGYARNSLTLNQATTPNSPASSSDSAYIYTG